MGWIIEWDAAGRSTMREPGTGDEDVPQALGVMVTDEASGRIAYEWGSPDLSVTRVLADGETTMRMELVDGSSPA